MPFSDLGESSISNRQKDTSSIIKNIRKLIYVFSILKVMTVSVISTYLQANAIISDLATDEFISSRFCQKYGLTNSLLTLTQ